MCVCMYLVMHHLSKEMCWGFGNEMCCALLLGELFGESFTLGETMKKSLRFLSDICCGPMIHIYICIYIYIYIYNICILYIYVYYIYNIYVITHGDV